MTGSYPRVGDRVRAKGDQMGDPNDLRTVSRKGARGRVWQVDEYGVYVDWDSGSSVLFLFDEVNDALEML